MDLNKNYYNILNISKECTKNEIKSSYRQLSKKYHPDLNNDIDPNIYKDIIESYKVLYNDDLKKEYDIKSKWGLNYDEFTELFDFNFKGINLDKYYTNEDFKAKRKEEFLNIVHYVNHDFIEGDIIYERLVICKQCSGTGKDDGKIKFVASDGQIKYFEGEDGCDMCDGTGKNARGLECFYCKGQGKIGLSECTNCKGNRRILGTQKLVGIKFPIDKQDMKIDSMGNFSNIAGKVGCLWLVRNPK